MTLKQQITNDLLATNGDKSKLFGVYQKWRFHTSYGEFRNQCQQLGIAPPRTIAELINAENRPAQPTSYSTSLPFLKKKREFQVEDLRHFLALKSPDDRVFNPNNAIQSLLKKNEIERIGKGCYRSLIYKN